MSRRGKVKAPRARHIDPNEALRIALESPAENYSQEDIDRHLDLVEAHILEHELHLDPFALQWGPVPLFMMRNGVVAAGDMGAICTGWKEDELNTESDWEFIRWMERTDLPAGTFFILVFHPPPTTTYGWKCCQPDLPV